MTSSPPTPPVTTSTTSPQVSLQFPSLFSGFSNLLLIALVVTVAFAVIVVVITRTANKIPYLSVNHKNADAIVVLVNSKLDELKILPARYVRQGLLHATDSGMLYLILVSPQVRPYRFGVRNYNKPVYFAVGDTPMFSAFDFGTIAKLDLLRSATGKKAILDVIVDIISTNKEITGYIPIASNYAFAYSIDPKSVITDETLSYAIDATAAMTRTLAAIGNDIREWSKLTQRIEKLKLMQSSLKMNTLIMMLAIGVVVVIMALVLAGQHLQLP